MKILGFGLMRPPMIGDAPDLEQVSKMVDLFLANGFTYFDTARAYMDGGNERMMRAALVERYPRECYTIADKLPIWLMKSKGFSAEEIFAQSLENSGAGYFDYYLLHAMSADNVQYADENGLWDFMKKLKAEGRVRQIGFSFHDTPEVLEEILTKHPEMEFVQLQINYADWENPSVQSRRCYEVARSFGKPVVIMEPVKGGTLAELGAETAALFDGVAPEVGLPARALRFAASLPGVRAVLSGMSTLAQMEENTATLAEVPVLSEAEQAAYTAVREKLASAPTIPCTACKYCMENCPVGMEIPRLFRVMNGYLTYGNRAKSKEDYARATKEHPQASECLSCYACADVCPQHLEIPELLRRVAETLE